MPETNWLTFNNFRSASTGGSAGDAVPAGLEVCSAECPLKLQVTFRIGNGGTADLPAGVHASLYGLQNGQWVFLVSVTTDAPIAPGSTSPAFTLDLDPLGVPEGQLRLVVDDENGVDLIDECHEDNNTLEVSDVQCAIRPPG